MITEGNKQWSIDSRLVDYAERTESAAIVDGKTDSGLPVMVIVITGANIGQFKKLAGDVLPIFKKPNPPPPTEPE